MAPFGATCVLLFSTPSSPLSQLANVIGGHFVSTAIGLLLQNFLPAEWWSLGLAVGLAIAAMAALRVTHPPARADPLVVFFDNPGWSYIGLTYKGFSLKSGFTLTQNFCLICSIPMDVARLRWWIAADEPESMVSLLPGM